jgi:hypothetical protein
MGLRHLIDLRVIHEAKVFPARYGKDNDQHQVVSVPLTGRSFTVASITAGA